MKLAGIVSLAWVFCAGAVTVDTEFLRISINTNGVLTEFIDRKANTNYAVLRPFALARVNGKLLPTTGLRTEGNILVFGFAPTSAELRLRLSVAKDAIIVETVSATGADMYRFVSGHLSLEGKHGEPFEACVLALSLNTIVPSPAYPKPSRFLTADIHAKSGFEHARLAIAAAPAGKLQRILRRLVKKDGELPWSPLGGPFADEPEVCRGSYLFAAISEADADAWIALAKNIGVTQLDFDGMSRYGDAAPYPRMYPNGLQGLKSVVDKVHAAGLKAGLHTYSGFMNKDCPWITPVPDKRLAKQAVFTLAKSLGPTNTEIEVLESTQDMSPVTGFFQRTGATLQIDDELVLFTEVRKEPPYRFLKCRRGLHGTKPAAHGEGAKVSNLKEVYSRFVPDPDTDLLSEVAARQAAVVNTCGFDMMYLDAIDGSGIFAGHELAGYYAAKFLFELNKHLDHPILFEMSAGWHHFWRLRSRAGAWDHPTRSHKQFIDLHCTSSVEDMRSYFPAHLGWWAMKTWSGIQGEPTFSDDIEYLCGKALAYDIGFSIQGINPSNYAKSALLQRLGGITRTYEDFRHTGKVPADIKEQLRKPGVEYTLRGGRLLRAEHARRFLRGNEGAFTVTNRFAEQPMALRMEVLMSADRYDSTNAVTLLDAATAPKCYRTAPKITAEIIPEGTGLCIRVRSGIKTRSGSWAGFERAFEPELNLAALRPGTVPQGAAAGEAGESFAVSKNLGDGCAVGVWVYGDGKGELLNFQLNSPEAVSRAQNEHYALIDFIGWRYFEFVEPESARWSDYQWPYGHLYSIYRERIDFRRIQNFRLWVNNVPAGEKIECRIGAVKALPLVRAVVTNPEFEINGKRVRIPVTVASGCYLELEEGQARVFGTDGALLSEVPVVMPVIPSGALDVRFSAESATAVPPRVRFTVHTREL